MAVDVFGVLEAERGVAAGSLRLPLWIAGRLISIDADQLQIADAEVERSYELAAGPAAPTDSRPALSPGDLVRVQLVEIGGRRVVATVERCAVGRLGAGEHTRRLGRRLRARSAGLRALRAYFERHEFLEVDTPTRVPAPGLDLHVDALPAGNEWLITSPEHHMKRLLVAGAQRIYQLARASRAEELGPLHEPEFLLLEWYRAYAGLPQMLEDTEQLVCALVGAVRGVLAEPQPTGAALTDAQLRVGARVIDLTRPFPRVSVRDAFRRYALVDDVVALARDDEDRYFQLLVDQVEPALARLDHPVFLHGYPLSQASLAQPDPRDPETAERFELYVAGVELCNGFGELNDAAEQRRRYVAAQSERFERGMPVYPLDEPFLAALEEGMPPAGGNALGVDRLLMLAMNEDSLERVVLFPTPRPG